MPKFMVTFGEPGNDGQDWTVVEAEDLATAKMRAAKFWPDSPCTIKEMREIPVVSGGMLRDLIAQKAAKKVTKT